MPETTCNACGKPCYRNEIDTDAGAEVYCSEACAALPKKPEQWTTSDSSLWGHNPVEVFVDHNGNYESVAFVYGGPKRDERIALIAAAPDLLAAVEAFVQAAKDAHEHWDADRDAKVGKLLAAMAGHLTGYRKELSDAHQALAKARGK